jgi:hypothetical protein
MKPIELSQQDLDTMAERLRVHRADKAKYLPQSSGASARQAADGNMVDAGKPPARQTLHYSDPTCQDCDPGYPCATHARRCEGCFAADDLHNGAASASKRGPGVTALVELWCATCDPPVPVGERFADGQPDPWSLSDEELVTTADLPREPPAYWGRARDEYDPTDDKQDIQPFGRTTK